MDNSSDSFSATPVTPAAGAPAVFPCPRCGVPLEPGTLACPRCGELVYRQRLQQLANDALTLEAADPARAAMIWREALSLLPQNSPQYASIYQRIGALSAGFMPAGNGAAPAALDYQPRSAERRTDTWPVALVKTGGSMLLSILVYGMMFGGDFRFALGFVLLILVHEMGHVVAMWYYGLRASPPIFIPFVGALINLRQNPPNAFVEAVVGIGGPLAGTLGALVCYCMFLWMPQFHTALLFELSVVGFVLNFFNLLPMPPLDGGRITAAISPWIWIVGVVGLIALMVRDIRHSNYGIIILLMILFYGLPRVRATLAARGQNIPYYKISRLASGSIAALYITLAVTLSLLLWVTDGFRVFGF